MKHIKKTLILSLILVLVLALSGCDIADTAFSSAGQAASVNEVSSDERSADFEVRMLDVGQGLAVLIKADDKYLLYDGGGRYTSSYVVSYLEKHGIENLDYLIASHYDEDHIYGLVGVLSTTKVALALTPDYTTDTEVYASFRRGMGRSEASEVHPEAGDSYELGGATIEILGPRSYNGGEDNDKSIAVRVSYGDFSVIMTGDQSSDGEAEIIRYNRTVQSQLYIVGHHGSSHSSSTEFLKKIGAKYAFISAGADNSYGHPAADTLERLASAGCKIFRTDLQGEVAAYSDGENVWFETEHKASDEALSVSGENSGDAAGAKGKSASENTTYVINTNSGKFHYPDCYSVDDMAEYNKQFTESTRGELIEQGYSPCGNCKP